MKNKLSDLNDHLFMQLERLGDEDMTPEQIDSEVRRTDAIVHVADKIITNAGLQLRAATLLAEHGYEFMPQLKQIGPDARHLTTIEGKSK